jgi:GDPmannose 4,6-dehydratase
LSRRRALITGAAGQDGSYLAELLVADDYDVVGVVRDPERAHENLAAVRDKIELVAVDLLDHDALAATLRAHRPTEVYNLASPSFVPRSWEHPVETAEFAAVGVTSLLEAVRAVDTTIRVYQASSSEIFGEPVTVPQTESTPLSPVTPYGVAKAYGHFIVGSYRRRYGLHASGGILYNHDLVRLLVDAARARLTSS